MADRGADHLRRRADRQVHAFAGVSVPLALLAVQGWRRVLAERRLGGRNPRVLRFLVTAGVVVLVFGVAPATTWLLINKRLGARAVAELDRPDADALDYIARQPRGGVLSTPKVGIWDQSSSSAAPRVGLHSDPPQADIVMVGAILGDRAAGLYGAAAKTASLVGLILIAVNAFGAPMLSALFAQHRHQDLQQLASATAAWAFWPSCLLSIILATCAPLVLATFGPAFASAEWQLRVLLVGQIINAAAGSVGWLMLLSGRQNVAAWVYGWVALIHVVLLAVVIPVFGTV